MGMRSCARERALLAAGLVLLSLQYPELTVLLTESDTLPWLSNVRPCVPLKSGQGCPSSMLFRGSLMLLAGTSAHKTRWQYTMYHQRQRQRAHTAAKRAGVQHSGTAAGSTRQHRCAHNPSQFMHCACEQPPIAVEGLVDTREAQLRRQQLQSSCGHTL
jgi:hypothetical protein